MSSNGFWIFIFFLTLTIICVLGATGDINPGSPTGAKDFSAFMTLPFGILTIIGFIGMFGENR